VNTPDWSKAPEVATHWDKECDIFCDENGFWYSDGRYRKLLAGVHVKWGTSRYIPRHVQWRGPQDGLPPVGTEVEIRSGKEWYKAKVIAHGTERNAHIAILQADDWIAVRGSDAEGVRPIQSDRDRAIEEMHKIAVDACGHEAGLIPRINIARALYDAGYRKT
jgi:hypothetical protein